MQKKSNFVKINKSAPLICALVVLMLSIFAGKMLTSRYNHNGIATDKAHSSIYKQLELYRQDKKTELLKYEKMNNQETENANTTITASPLYNTQNTSCDNIRVLASESGKIAEMSLDDYVLCALVAEMPLSFDIQALMAQAVAIRTYTVRCVLHGSKHKNADVCDDYRCCQSMIHPQDIDFDISKAIKAVDSTAEIIAVYDGQPILAAYHSSSVGTTKSSEEVWGGKLDYLIPVFAPEDKSVSENKVKIDKKKLKSAFEKNGLYGDIVFESDTDGICVCARIDGKTVSANKIKQLAGLRSDTFSVSEQDNYYVFVSYGYGHGVGMSQYGAQALALDGFSFYEILKYYYTGISFGLL